MGEVYCFGNSHPTVTRGTRCISRAPSLPAFLQIFMVLKFSSPVAHNWNDSGNIFSSPSAERTAESPDKIED